MRRSLQDLSDHVLRRRAHGRFAATGGAWPGARRRDRPWLRAGLLAVLAVALLVALWPLAPVAAATPVLRVEPARGPCDGTFTIRGQGFGPGEAGRLVLRPRSRPRQAQPEVIEARADAAGHVAVAIPPGFVSCLPATGPGGEETHDVCATLGARVCPDGSDATATFTTTPAPGRCFAETGFCVAGRFLQHWQQRGGLAINGYPLSDVFTERLEDGQEYAVQYFERVRLEAHPEAGVPYDVQLGQFGRRLHPADPPAARRPGATYYAQTGHNLGGRFRDYWETNGGLDQFGYPLSEEFEERLEDGKRYRVQYFERARFEYHPENAAPYDVLLGQFGRRILAAASRR